jgi:GTPase SAR1 family protein
LAQFLDGKFKIDHDTTIGVEFGSKVIKVDNKRYVKLQVWDTVCLNRRKKNLIHTKKIEIINI